jgi:hypothetical protein
MSLGWAAVLRPGGSTEPRERRRIMRTSWERNRAAATLQAWVGCRTCYADGAVIGRWLPAFVASDLAGAGFETAPARADGRRRCGRCGNQAWWVFEWGFGDTSCADLVPGECTPEEAQRVAQLVALRESLPAAN